MSIQEYKKTSKDPDLALPYPVRKGHSREENGRPRNGVYVQTFKKTETKRYIRNGNVYGTFRYPRITPSFSSPLVNDYNQHLCGGWYWKYREDGSVKAPFESGSDITLERIKAGTKPLGSLVGWEDNKEQVVRWREQIRSAGLASRSYREGIKNTLLVCRKGVMDELFDFDDLISDYIDFDKKTKFSALGSRKKIKILFNSLRKDSLEKYLLFDHYNPCSNFDYVITGLILGYPIENTYSVLVE